MDEFNALFAQMKALIKIVDDLSMKLNEPPSDTILKALTIYEIAVQATQQGSHIAVLDREWGFVREIKGIAEVKGDDGNGEKSEEESTQSSESV